jgi:hypothetical protein
MNKNIAFIMIALFAFSCKTKDEVKTKIINPEEEIAAIELAINTLKDNLIEPTEENLKAISHPDLTYGHSTGTIEDQAAFMDALLSGNNDYKTYEISDQVIKLEGSTAWVRHTMDAEVVIPTETLNVHLNVLTVWVKVNGEWILYARQAVKV